MTMLSAGTLVMGRHPGRRLFLGTIYPATARVLTNSVPESVGICLAIVGNVSDAFTLSPEEQKP